MFIPLESPRVAAIYRVSFSDPLIKVHEFAVVLHSAVCPRTFRRHQHVHPSATRSASPCSALMITPTRAGELVRVPDVADQLGDSPQARRTAGTVGSNSARDRQIICSPPESWPPAPLPLAQPRELLQQLFDPSVQLLPGADRVAADTQVVAHRSWGTRRRPAASSRARGRACDETQMVRSSSSIVTLPAHRSLPPSPSAGCSYRSRSARRYR